MNAGGGSTASTSAVDVVPNCRRVERLRGWITVLVLKHLEFFNSACQTLLRKISSRVWGWCWSHTCGLFHQRGDNVVRVGSTEALQDRKRRFLCRHHAYEVQDRRRPDAADARDARALQHSGSEVARTNCLPIPLPKGRALLANHRPFTHNPGLAITWRIVVGPSLIGLRKGCPSTGQNACCDE
jgi:hypothetical protein